MKNLLRAAVTGVLLFSVTARAEAPAFKSEATGTFVAQAPDGDCAMALKSTPFGLTIAHIEEKDHKLTKDGIWMFTLKDAIVPKLASAVGKYGNGEEVKALFDREKSRIDFLLFEKAINANKKFTIHLRAMNDHLSSHDFNLSDFAAAKAVIDNGCKPVGDLWDSIKQKVTGGSN